jgi:penicillin-binding protein 2
MARTRKGMRAVTEPGGTSYYLFRDFPIEVAGKTGTAQTGRSGDDKSSEFHGLFVAFAPYENPEVAFAGIVEYGQHGGSSAGIIARAVFAEYFGEKDYKNVDEIYGLSSPLIEE